MRRLFVVLLVIVTAFVLFGCQSEAAKKADALISDIGSVTLESEKAIVAAEEYVSGLGEEDLKQVAGLELLNKARADYDVLLLKKDAEQVDALINKIGEVTDKSELSINKAKKAYENLSSEAKEYVVNAKVLEEAEVKFNTDKANAVSEIIDGLKPVTLDSGSAIEEADKQFNSLTDEQKSLVTNYEALKDAKEQLCQLKADVVIKEINEIGEVSLESSEKIASAREAYDALTGNDQKYVDNKDVLEQAEKSLKELQKAEIDEKLDKVLSSMKKTEDQFGGTIDYWPSAWSFYGEYWAADKGSFVRPYIELLGGTSPSIRLVYNYNGDDWVFFESVGILVDGKEYIKGFSYFDVERDTAWGSVFEYIDRVITQEDLEMLREIADSEETIVRFAGKNYKKDITLSSKDKQAIKDCLLVYDGWTMQGKNFSFGIS